MARRITYFVHLFVLALGLFFIPAAKAETNILFIVDGSNSMWGQIDETAKVETARKTLSKLVSDLPADSKLALMAYGHTREGDCSDVELLSALGKDAPQMITTLIHTIQPTGKTPIANALEKSREVFKGKEGQNNHILLVSDGIESCDGDPCAVAKKLQEDGFNVRAHVVGFGVSKEEGKQLNCIADNTGGKYFDAANAEAFNVAVAEVTEITQAEPEPEPEPEPAPAEPKLVTYFEDQFDVDGLSDSWEVLNPEPDSYLVEDGELLMINSTYAAFAEDNIPNIMRINKEIPDGDWVATMKLNIDFQSGFEHIFFGVYDDPENYLLSAISTAQGSCYSGGSYKTHMYLSTWKASSGKVTTNQQEVWSIPRCNREEGFNELMAMGQPYLMRLTKKGRMYTAAIKVEGAEEPVWIEVPGLKILRTPKGGFTTGVYQSSKGAQGETALNIDWIKVETLESEEASEESEEASE